MHKMKKHQSSEFTLHKESLFKSFSRLMHYCEKQNYQGWDPFDGMNSKIFQATPFKNWKLSRIAWIQLFKRSPINLRPLFLVPKQFNTKGLGLFLYGYCELYQYAIKHDHIFGSPQVLLEKISYFADQLIGHQSKGYQGACWGYNFDWQSRVFFQPTQTPTVVATSFVASALFKAYETTQNIKYLHTALSSCQFVTESLNKSPQKNGGFIFSYSPLDHSEVYNASLLGARLLAQAYHYTQNPQWQQLSRSAIKTIVELQSPDGSWVYGRKNNQQWIDSFHTGFNLECISEYAKFTGDKSFQKAFDHGMEYYLNTFFLPNGTPKYYHNSVYPIDIHSPAQLIATLAKTGLFEQHADMAEKVLNYTIRNMQSPKGYFYYQLKPFLSSKIPYMRWAQAWMFYALSIYINMRLQENRISATAEQ